MSANNRAALISQALKIVKKHFKPREVAKDRNLLEHMLYACCLENSLHEPADRVFMTLSTEYFDWNEVRVSSIRELSEVTKHLHDPEEAATRIKRMLQSVFETHYSYDMEPLKKQNIGQAVKQLGSYNGNTPFISAYITQNALGGHAIPVSNGLLECLRIVGIVSDSEASKGAAPGLERAIPKNKGVESASLLHQLGVEMTRSPFGPTLRKLLLEINPECKERLPKRSATKAEAEAEAAIATQVPPQASKANADKATSVGKGATPTSEKAPQQQANASKGLQHAPAKQPKGKVAKADKNVVSKSLPKTAKPSDKKPAKKAPKKVVKKTIKKSAPAASKKSLPKKKVHAGAKPITRRKPR